MKSTCWFCLIIPLKKVEAKESKLFPIQLKVLRKFWIHQTRINKDTSLFAWWTNSSSGFCLPHSLSPYFPNILKENWVYHGLLGRNGWNVKTWESIDKLVSQQVKLLVPSKYLKRTFCIHSLILLNLVFLLGLCKLCSFHFWVCED